MSETSRRAAVEHICAEIRKRFAEDKGCSCEVIDTAIARAVAEKDEEIERLREQVGQAWDHCVIVCTAEKAQAIEGERERLTEIVVEEYNDALRNGLDHIASFRCMLAALRAPGEKAEMQKMIDRKNAALARPCINCGYRPKIVEGA